ncbi:TniQ family protein [Streptomyces phaeochromogenes]|uniref:TniQ family protein n=1 Tax=Streptomyces phaeochromogenes TaxID=1923 RepID=UPI002E296C9A|nr:TniQ family protein [Streptomyces phaeochromogenes]
MKGPLPRSLDPVPGELLPGYLLRIAHRIGIPPLDLAHWCRLTAAATSSARHLVRLTADQARQVATVCRLDEAEVDALTLAGQAPTYTPLHVDYLGRHQSHIAMANEGWVFTTFSRYCPECLAETANTPGGSVWHGSWRLPHTFLCLRHDRLLEWRCPACKAPAFSNGYGLDGRWRTAQLLPAPRHRLHPAQCRHRAGATRGPACAHRLDRISVPAIRPSTVMAHAQQRLAAATACPPGHAVESLSLPTSPQRFFNDVRLTTLAVSSTWPAAAELLPGAEHLDTITRHAQGIHRAPIDRAGPQPDGWVARSVDHPPADPLPAAALASVVVRILDDPDGATLLTRLLSQGPGSGAVHRRLRLLAPHCSPAVAAAHRDSAHRHRGAVGPAPLFPQPATHRGRLDPGSIPPVLPESWAGPLNELNGPAQQLRRDAAIRLVQMARDGTRAEAARYLGIPPGTLQATTLRIRTWQKQPGNAEAYQVALHRIAEIAIGPNGSDR